MKMAKAINFIRSAIPPTMIAGGMIANIIMKIMNIGFAVMGLA